MANHLISLPSKACQKQGAFPPSALPDFNGTIPLSDSRPGQNLLALLRATTSYLERVSHVAQVTFLTCRPHYPGRSERALVTVPCLFCFGLPRILGGSASTTLLSRPAQGSRVLRPARLLQPKSLHFSPELQQEGLPIPLSGLLPGCTENFPDGTCTRWYLAPSWRTYI